MKAFLAITKALADETRLRALLALRQDELCLCQLIHLLALAPSTVSKHMDILYQAGLVERRKQGRWHYFRLAGPDASPAARQALQWTLDQLAKDASIQNDASLLPRIQQTKLTDLCDCYNDN